MAALTAYPEACRKSIRTVAERLKTDYESAYFAILLECVMTDLSPSDPTLPDKIAPEGR